MRAISLVVWLLGLGYVAAESPEPYVAGKAAVDRFPLVGAQGAASILVEQGDHEVVRIAAHDLTLDVERVTGKQLLEMSADGGAGGIPQRVVIVGSLDRSSVIQNLVKSGKLDVKGIEGQWEAHTLQVVSDPLPGVKQALVIAGSDRRGTAYGVYELSRRIGVSPWYWWADVVPDKQEQLHVSVEAIKVGSPAVKYRGIFINDEMWGIRPWAEGTLAPEEGRGLGPTTYAKIFELLLRLRANYIWPAMHLHTVPFNVYPENKVVADRYAIVMGSSHIEPMLRNNMPLAEWSREGGGEWDYTVNRDSIYQYWERAVKSNGRYENMYTIGMRGQDDEPMKGGNTQAEKIALLERIFKDQREMLTRHVNPDPVKVPQVFIPYTEVLHLYDAGMKVPDDVTICWPDDNFGYIRRLPKADERKRSGGSGVYYHIQWINGATSAYAWLNTMPPPLIFTEMNKAWQYDCRKLWVLNVGDIKPGEIGMDFFLDMAWNPDKWTHENIGGYLTEWARRDLDPRYAEEIAEIMKEYYQLGFGRRPEHLVQYRNKIPLRYSWFSHQFYGDEAAKRLERYADIAQRAEAIYHKLPDARKDAFYQLVLYPVQCSSLMNQKVIHADRSTHDAESGRATARVHAQLARQASERIMELTDRYNKGLVTVGAKWQYMMHWAPGPWGGQRFQYEMPPLSDYTGLGRPRLLVVPEGNREDSVDDLSTYSRERRFIDLFNTGQGELAWKATTSEPWLKLDLSEGTFATGQRLWLDVDWNHAPKAADLQATVTFTSTKETFMIKVPVFNPASPARDQVSGYVESHGYVSMEAEHFSRRVERGGALWKVIDHLGRSGDAVVVHPATVESRVTPEQIRAMSPSMEYDFHVFSAGDFELQLDCLPAKPVSPDRGVRLAVSIDGGEPRLLDPKTDEVIEHRQWHGFTDRDIMFNLTRLRQTVKIDKPGKHTLTVWMVDPGVMLDKLVLYTKAPKVSYFGPPESYWAAKPPVPSDQ